MAAKENLFPLKMLVISLGVLLFGGVIFLMITLIDRKDGCAPQALQLAEYGEIVSITSAGRDTSIILKDNGKYQSLRVDGCTGVIRQQLSVVGK